ncbi:MAG: hypothetical protein HLX51_00935 [Micrococcaceae bacterium]|nr:hypothetical protein [Micrococcaceae bacterium]
MNETAKQTKAPKVKKPRRPMSVGTRRLISVVASIIWGMLVTMLVFSWLSGLYTAENMATLMPAILILLTAVPLAIAAFTTKQPKLLIHLYQPLSVAALVLIVFPLYIPVVILFGTIWITLVWVRRTPLFWGDNGQPTEK